MSSPNKRSTLSKPGRPSKKKILNFRREEIENSESLEECDMNELKRNLNTVELEGSSKNKSPKSSKIKKKSGPNETDYIPKTIEHIPTTDRVTRSSRRVLID